MRNERCQFGLKWNCYISAGKKTKEIWLLVLTGTVSYGTAHLSAHFRSSLTFQDFNCFANGTFSLLSKMNSYPFPVLHYYHSTTPKKPTSNSIRECRSSTFEPPARFYSVGIERPLARATRHVTTIVIRLRNEQKTEQQTPPVLTLNGILFIGISSSLQKALAIRTQDWKLDRDGDKSFKLFWAWN